MVVLSEGTEKKRPEENWERGYWQLYSCWQRGLTVNKALGWIQETGQQKSGSERWHEKAEQGWKNWGKEPGSEYKTALLWGSVW